jgi:hypothetical protein
LNRLELLLRPTYASFLIRALKPLESCRESKE